MTRPLASNIQNIQNIDAGELLVGGNTRIAEGFSRMEDVGEKGALKVERGLQRIEGFLTTPKFHIEVERESFQHKLTFILLLMFGIPCVSCSLLSTHPSVSYWIGPMGTRASFACLLWVIVGHHTFVKANRRVLVIQLLILPALALITVSHYMKLVSLNAATQLELDDCSSFEDKVRIEQAWQEAHTILADCIARKASITGSPVEEVERVTSVQNCDDYIKGLPDWGREWEYLQRLELREDCSGWCTAARPLWHPIIEEDVIDGSDRCSLVVAGIMRHEILRTTYQIIGYCATIVVVLGFVFSMIEF